MKSGVWNIAFGLLGLAAGISGRFALPFTQGPVPLIVVSAGVALLGLAQIARSRKA
jgi:hypothetical protein